MRRAQGTLLELKWFFDDRCCNGAHNPEATFLRELFPSVVRAPLADGFHSVQVRCWGTVVGSTR